MFESIRAALLGGLLRFAVIFCFFAQGFGRPLNQTGNLPLSIISVSVTPKHDPSSSNTTISPRAIILLLTMTSTASPTLRSNGMTAPRPNFVS